MRLNWGFPFLIYYRTFKISTMLKTVSCFNKLNMHTEFSSREGTLIDSEWERLKWRTQEVSSRDLHSMSLSRVCFQFYFKTNWNSPVWVNQGWTWSLNYPNCLHHLTSWWASLKLGWGSARSTGFTWIPSSHMPMGETTCQINGQWQQAYNTEIYQRWTQNQHCSMMCLIFFLQEKYNLLEENNDEYSLPCMVLAKWGSQPLIQGVL